MMYGVIDSNEKEIGPRCSSYDAAIIAFNVAKKTKKVRLVFWISDKEYTVLDDGED